MPFLAAEGHHRERLRALLVCGLGLGGLIAQAAVMRHLGFPERSSLFSVSAATLLIGCLTSVTLLAALLAWGGWRTVDAILFAAAVLTAAIAMLDAHRLFYEVGALCRPCYLPHLFAAGILFAGAESLAAVAAMLPDWWRRHPSIGALAIMIVGAAPITSGVLKLSTLTRQCSPVTPHRVADYSSWRDSLRRQELPVPTEGASILVVRFVDLECPACRAEAERSMPVLKRFGDSHPGALRVVTKYFPLDSECNDLLRRPLHPLACEAAVAVDMSPLAKQEALSRWIFDHRATISSEALWEATRQLTGISNSKAEHEASLDRVRADVALGRSVGVRATPTVFVNGLRTEAGPAEWLARLLEEEWAASKVRKLAATGRAQPSSAESRP